MLETNTKDGVVIELQPQALGELPHEELSKAHGSNMEVDEKDERAKVLKIKFIFLFLGILSLLPWNILLNAEGFFRKKLENTYFKHNFPLFLQANAVFANLLGSFLMFFLNKVFSTRKIALGVCFTFSAPLIVVTALAKINTDSWAEEFFILVMIMYCINAVSHGIMTSTHSILCTMIQADLLKTYYIGKGLAGIAGSAVALTTLAFPTVDVISAAFYYFMVMTLLTMVGATLLTVYLLNLDLVKQRTVKTNYSEDENTEQNEVMSLKEIARAIKMQSISGFLVTVNSLLVFPATLTNLRSVDPKPGTDWSDKFFLPVTVYLIWTIGDNSGKILTEFVNWPNRDMMLWISIGRLVLLPLTLMTNIQPRTVPVWFKSDVIPSILCFLTAFTGGYLVNLNLTYAPGYVQGKENQGKASMVMFFFIAAGLAVGSAGIFVVPVILAI